MQKKQKEQRQGRRRNIGMLGDEESSPLCKALGSQQKADWEGAGMFWGSLDDQIRPFHFNLSRPQLLLRSEQINTN